MEVKRYDWDFGSMFETSGGDYILHSDHLAAMKAKDREIADLNQRLRLLDEENEILLGKVFTLQTKLEFSK